MNFGEREAGFSIGGYVMSLYDGNGNPGRVTYPSGTYVNLTYDKRQQPTTLNFSTGQLVTYAYDFDKRRYKKTNSLGTTSYYVFDGNQVIAETDSAKVITVYHIAGLGMIKANCDRRFYRDSAIGSS